MTCLMRDDHIRLMLKHAGEEQYKACIALWSANADRFAASPGSMHNHQAWPGGYLDHVHDTMITAVRLFNALPPPLPFELGDPMVVLFVHDIEKPWRYVEPFSTMGASKLERQTFRLHQITKAGIRLSPQQHNALTYVEGEGEDYRSDQRVMGELAAFCHMCDVASARIYHSRPGEPALFAALDG